MISEFNSETHALEEVKVHPFWKGGSFTQDVLLTFATQIIIFFGAALTSIMIARALGPSGKGLVAIAMLIPTMAALIGGLGINIANTYYSGKSTYANRMIMSNSLFISVFVGGLLTGVFLYFTPQLTGILFRETSFYYLYFTVPLVTLLLVQENLSYLLLGNRKILQLSFLNIFRAFSYLMFLVLFLYLMKMEIMGAIWANILAIVTTMIVVFYFMIKNRYGISISFHKTIFLDTLKFGLKGHLGTIFQYLNYRFDFLIVAFFLPLSSVGHYEVAVLLAEMIWYIPNSISQILLPKTASSNKADADHFTPIVSRHTFFLTVIASVTLFFISQPLIPFLFTPQFSPSVLALKFLLPGIIALSIWKILITDLTGRGHPQYRTYTTAISVCVTIILDILLIPRWGIVGAAVATSIAYLVASLLSLIWFMKISGVAFHHLFMLKKNDLKYYADIIKSLHLSSSN